METAALAHVTLLRALRFSWARRGRRRRPAHLRPRLRASTSGPRPPRRGRGGRSLGPRSEDWRTFTVELKIRKGWHLNANPAGASLVATTIVPVLGKLRGLRYPEGEPFGPASDVIAIYRGRLRLEGEIDHQRGRPRGGAHLPACDDAAVCLRDALVRLQ